MLSNKAPYLIFSSLLAASFIISSSEKVYSTGSSLNQNQASPLQRINSFFIEQDKFIEGLQKEQLDLEAKEDKLVSDLQKEIRLINKKIADAQVRKYYHDFNFYSHRGVRMLLTGTGPIQIQFRENIAKINQLNIKDEKNYDIFKGLRTDTVKLITIPQGSLLSDYLLLSQLAMFSGQINYYLFILDKAFGLKVNPEFIRKLKAFNEKILHRGSPMNAVISDSDVADFRRMADELKMELAKYLSEK